MTNEEKTLASIKLATNKANKDEWLVTLLSSIAISLAVIADHIEELKGETNEEVDTKQT